MLNPEFHIVLKIIKATIENPPSTLWVDASDGVGKRKNNIAVSWKTSEFL